MKYIAGILAAAAVIFGAVAVAQAEDIISSAGANTYDGGPFHIAAGETPNYVNPAGSLGYHNVVSEDDGPDGEKLFESEAIPANSSSPVVGAQYLSPGTYHFVCTIHPGMEDDLIVDPGTPVARPAVKLSVPSQKLKKARKSGKIKVDVKGVADSTGVDLTLSKGKAVIGTAADLAVDKGKTRTVSVVLTSAGAKAIKKGKKVTFSVTAQVPWGKPAKTSRALR